MEIVTIVLVLLVLVIFGNLWYSLVEGILKMIKGIFTSGKKPPVWHTLPNDEDKRDK